jgi:hypothetical protein
VLRNSDGKLKVYLNFGDVDPLFDLTDDWEIVPTISNDRIELKHVSGNDEGTAEIVTILVFEKLP